MSQLINTIIVLSLILVIWFLLRLLFRKLVEPHKAYIHSPGIPSKTNKLGYLAVEKRSSGFDSVLIDDKKLNNKEVAEVFVVEDQNAVEFRNILLIDNSGSTENQMPEYKKALKSFISTPFSGEKNAIYTFSDKLTLCCDFTESQSALINAIDAIQPGGATAMNDAVIAAADLIATQEILEERDGKSIFYNIILFTDGMDNVSKNDPQEVMQRLNGKTLFAVCTKDADLPLMYELAKNPRNVFIIGSSSNVQTTLGNAAVGSLEEALLKIRNEKLKGRGTCAYVQIKDEDNQYKIRGFVNLLGEIYSCGYQGETRFTEAFFRGLCEDPGSEESKVYLGNYIVASRSNEDYFINAKGSFGRSKQSIPITPTAISAGAWVIYQLNKKEDKRSKPENVINAFPKVALFSLILWCPLFLMYWLLNFTMDVNILGFLGKEFDITISQILLFFLLWTIISSLYVDLLRRKKGFMLFNNALNNLVGTRGLLKIIISICLVGIILSVLVFLPFSYSAFFVCTLLAFSSNLFLNFGGGKTWYINQQDPDYIRPFSGEGTKVRLEFDYLTSDEKSDTKIWEVKTNGNSTKFTSLKEAVLDTQSRNVIDYLENCVHITSIVENYNPLSESMMLSALGSLKSKPVSISQNDFNSPSQILLQKDISLVDKLIFTIALFTEAGHEVIYTDDFSSFAFRTPRGRGDSPCIFEYEQKNFFCFSYNEKTNAFERQEPEGVDQINWNKV